jgi:hypothetical protein
VWVSVSLICTAKSLIYPRMRANRLPSVTRRHALGCLSAAIVALGAAACAEDSTAPPSTGADAAPASPATGKYRLTPGGNTLVGPSDMRIPIDPKLTIGYVDAVATPKSGFIDLSGWGAPTDLSGPAETIVAIAGKKSVAVTPSIERPDLVKGYDRPGLERSGFVMSIPVSALDCSAPQQGLETFAVANGAAAPLEWLADVPKKIADAC